jgi:hypothetical protein
MINQTESKDPMEFIRGMWSKMGFNLPGAVTPTLDIKELDKRINNLRAVESWLKMNLNMLQLSIQGMEMQRNTIATMKSIGQSAAGQGESGVHPLANVALWPWNLMQQAVESAAAITATPSSSEKKSAAETTPKNT